MIVDITEELKPIYAALDKILLRLGELESRQLPEWVDIKTACAWKGVKKSTIENNKELMPPESERERVGHRKLWPREVILEWAKRIDEELEAGRLELAKAM
jgi:hypothetical protein